MHSDNWLRKVRLLGIATLNRARQILHFAKSSPFGEFEPAIVGKERRRKGRGVANTCLDLARASDF